MQLRFCSSITQLDKNQWQALLASRYPFLHYDFLLALEQSGCVGANTGWQPNYLWVSDDHKPIGCAPVFIKTDSWGEYIFDWAWADAYQRAGRAYYPKAVCAVPFTPATGPRMLGNLIPEQIHSLQTHLEHWAERSQLSSIHWLLARQSESDTLSDDWPQRQSTQFHWFNQDYADFDQFLSHFNARKRKNVLRERRKVAEAGFELTRKTGAQITAEDWDFFYQCYRSTYLKRSGHAGYFNRVFFQLLGSYLADQCLLVIAQKAQQPLACALYLFDDDCLYGRYWGCLQEWECLHFEACYYQGIEFAIEKKLQRFDAGAQGEHKIQRGFTPVPVYSNHWIKDADARAAINAFIAEESHHNSQYLEAARELLPFKQQ